MSAAATIAKITRRVRNLPLAMEAIFVNDFAATN
jgi:hypothetical protein